MFKRKKKGEVGSPKGLLKIKLGTCFSGPTASAYGDLWKAADWYNDAYNIALRWWQRYMEDHPECVEDEKMVFPSVTGEDGKERAAIMGPRGKAMSMPGCMYQAAVAAVPRLGAGIVSTASKAAWQSLQARMPWNYERDEGYRWSAILARGRSLDCRAARTFDIRAGDIVLAYEGEVSSDTAAKKMAEMSKSQCLLRFPLHSRHARKECDIIFALKIGDLPPGQRLILKKLIRREWKIAGSKIVFKQGEKRHKRHGRWTRNGEWFFHLTFEQALEDLGLDEKRVAVLEAGEGRDPASPLRISFEDISWKIGNNQTLPEVFSRIETRRKVLQLRHKGHGRGHFFKAIRKVTRKSQHTAQEYVKKTVAEIMKFCVRFGCGTIEYREPNSFMRKHSWFTKKKMPFDWTDFKSRLNQKCLLHVIKLEKRMAERKVPSRKGKKPPKSA